MKKEFFSRRDFVVKSVMLAGSTLILPKLVFANENQEATIPLIDYHVHLTRGFTIADAVKLSKEREVKFGIVEHPGPRYSSMNDNIALLKYINNLRKYPVFVGLQPVEPGWRKNYSEDVLSKLDYIIMDALELPNDDGSFFRIWESNTKVDNSEKFMDRYLEFYKYILENEKLDILASPTYLPDSIKKDYSGLWTTKRMETLIGTAINNDVAIEINSMYKIPDDRFIQLAKKMGAKFSFGTNGRTKEIVGELSYSLDCVKSCALQKTDMFGLK